MNRIEVSQKIFTLLLAMFLGAGVLTGTGVRAESPADRLTLDQALATALSHDPLLVKSRHAQKAVESMSVAAGTWTDPKVSVALANMPTDTFDFSQEAMTQFKVGISQMIPRGDSLDLKRRQLKELAEQFPQQRLDRKAKLSIQVATLWFDSYLAQESIRLIEADRPLFEQLSEVAEASYSSALGKTRQQDIIRAQLELTRLDDRLTGLQQKREMSMEKLGNILSGNFSAEYLGESVNFGTGAKWSGMQVTSGLPYLKMLRPKLYTAPEEIDAQLLYEAFVSHPAVVGLEAKIRANRTGVELARQKYVPAFGVTTSYSYRDQAPNGNDRADLVSLGVSFDLPFFTGNRQDKEVEAAMARSEAVKTEKWFLLRNMVAEFEKNRARLLRLTERQSLYQDTLLPQLHEQAEASLTAYTNDDGDFAEVVRSRIAELNGHLAALKIEVERQKTVLALNYFFMKQPGQIAQQQR